MKLHISEDTDYLMMLKLNLQILSPKEKVNEDLLYPFPNEHDKIHVKI